MTASTTYTIPLVCQLSLDELAVQAGNVSNRLVLRADCLASASVGAVTETKLFHSHHHVLCAACSLYTTLWKQRQAPQPMQEAQSIASSASSFGIRIALAS